MQIDSNLFILLSIIYFNRTEQKNVCHLFSQNNRPIYECMNAFSLHQLPKIPSGTMVLRIINASINTLTAINNTDIVTIVLNHCNISDISSNAFDYATNLKRLDLSHNMLSVINFNNTRSSIKELILAYNDFLDTPDVRGLQLLTYLDLSHNKIAHITPNSLLSPRLELIDLSYNYLTNIKRTDFGNTIRIVELDENLWRCDCHLRDFIAFQRETLIANSARCHNPLTIQNVKWDELMLNDFACGPVIQGGPIEEVKGVETGNIQLECFAWGDPKPKLFWKNNKSKDDVASDGRIQIETSDDVNSTVIWQTLQIQDVRREDEGSYWCKASTAFKSATKQFRITVLGNKQILPKKHTITTESQSKEMNSSGENFITKGPIWKVMLIVVVVLAFTLFFIACCVFFAYLQKTKRKNLRETVKGEKKEETRCLPEEKCEVISNDLEGENIRTALVREPSSPALNNRKRNINDWTRKAPLAQQDRDTSLLPIVQTSL